MNIQKLFNKHKGHIANIIEMNDDGDVLQMNSFLIDSVDKLKIAIDNFSAIVRENLENEIEPLSDNEISNFINGAIENGFAWASFDIKILIHFSKLQ